MQNLPNGLEREVLKAGGGTATAQSGDTVTVNYSGWLTNGTLFDSSYNPGRSPFSFQLGAGQVIPGWDEGVAGMKVGETVKLIIPPALGYGSTGQGPIPPNATLVFEVNLLAISPG